MSADLAIAQTRGSTVNQICSAQDGIFSIYFFDRDKRLLQCRFLFLRSSLRFRAHVLSSFLCREKAHLLGSRIVLLLRYQMMCRKCNAADEECGIYDLIIQRSYRRKIEASIINSRIFLEIAREFGSFDRYIWGFTNGKSVRESCELRTTSPLSDEISKDLKRRGMKFVGSICIYSTLQAIGVLAAHTDECDWSK